VPDDIAVIGYDDIYLAELLTPTLTTLRLKQTKQDVGAMAARMLLERMENGAKQTPVILNHELIIRASAP
jgi:LacI family transcriptional regulator